MVGVHRGGVPFGALAYVDGGTGSKRPADHLAVATGTVGEQLRDFPCRSCREPLG